MMLELTLGPLPKLDCPDGDEQKLRGAELLCSEPGNSLPDVVWPRRALRAARQRSCHPTGVATYFQRENGPQRQASMNSATARTRRLDGTSFHTDIASLVPAKALPES